MGNMNGKAAEDAQEEIEAQYAQARSIVARHGLKRISADLLEKYVWTAHDIQLATGLTSDEIGELVQTECVRSGGIWQQRGGVTIRDDILDLLGVRWTLPDDTLETYVERCMVVGVAPDKFQFANLLDEGGC